MPQEFHTSFQQIYKKNLDQRWRNMSNDQLPKSVFFNYIHHTVRADSSNFFPPIYSDTEEFYGLDSLSIFKIFSSSLWSILLKWNPKCLLILKFFIKKGRSVLEKWRNEKKLLSVRL